MDEYDIDTPENLAMAVQWQSSLVRLLGEGNKWAVPRSGAIYTVYPSKKLVIAKNSERNIDTVFEAMGWEIQHEV